MSTPLDPKAWVRFETSHRISNRWHLERDEFKPRPEYEQDRSKYAE